MIISVYVVLSSPLIVVQTILFLLPYDKTCEPIDEEACILKSFAAT